MHSRNAFSAAVLLLAIALSGCVGQPSDVGGAGMIVSAPPIAGLTAKSPANVMASPQVVVFQWTDTMPQTQRIDGVLVSVPQPGSPAPATKTFEFEVGPGVGAVIIAVKVADAASSLALRVYDAAGGIACKDLSGAQTLACAIDPPPGLEAPQWWKANVTAVDVPDAAGTAFSVDAGLVAGLPFQPKDLTTVLDTTISFSTHKTGGRVGEPTMGVDSKGNIFVLSGLALYKSSDKGATWRDVSPQIANTAGSADPMMRVDPYTDRIWVSQLQAAVVGILCSTLSYSDDGGATWVTNPAGCGWPSGDHQKLTVGSTSVPMAPWDGILYYAAHDTTTDSVFVSRSLDGGLVFQPVFAGISTRDNYQGLWTGTVEADRAGNVFISWAEAKEGGKNYISVSNDYGANYEMSVFGEGWDYWSFNDADFAFDDAGNTYYVWQGNTTLYYSMSKDHGKTWGAPVRINPPEIPSITFPAAVGSVKGKLAVTYYGTAQTPLYSDNAPGWTEWHLFATIVDGADTASPAMRHVQVTPDSDPAQRGSICTTGSSCNPGTRNLLDFIDIVTGPDGRFYIAYTDGCDPAHQDPKKVCDETGATKLADNWVAIEK
ncbi:MAG: exo-alpha-sialidase [Euryarchaeota archaeon]|nr:exo-alpha-sialidase [Euryarchaeota archaeon]